MQERKDLKAAWIGRPVEQLEKHPFFSDLTVETKPSSAGSEVRTYMEGAPALTKARCQALGGCMGVNQNWCENVFTIHKGLIVDFEQVGPCPYNSELLPI